MTNSFICRGPELWGELSQNTKESKSLSSFKKQIKNIHIIHIQIEYGSIHDPAIIHGLGGWVSGWDV